MKTRGKILRLPGASDGIVMIEGQQFRFRLEGIWKSDGAPQPGQSVEVELDRELQVIGLSVITEAQALNQVGQASLENEPNKPSSTGIFARLYTRFLGRDRKKELHYP